MAIDKVKINNVIYDTWSTKEDLIVVSSELEDKINSAVSTIDVSGLAIQGSNSGATNSAIYEILSDIKSDIEGIELISDEQIDDLFT